MKNQDCLFKETYDALYEVCKEVLHGRKLKHADMAIVLRACLCMAEDVAATLWCKHERPEAMVDLIREIVAQSNHASDNEVCEYHGTPLD